MTATYLDPLGEVARNDKVEPHAANPEAPQPSENVYHRHDEHPPVTIVPEHQRTLLLVDGHTGRVVASFITPPHSAAAPPPPAEADTVAVAQAQRGKGEQEKRARKEHHYRVHPASETPHDGGPLANLAEEAELVPLAVQLPAHVSVELDEIDALGV